MRPQDPQDEYPSAYLRYPEYASCMSATYLLCVFSGVADVTMGRKIASFHLCFTVFIAQEDLEMEVAVMLIDCCAMERTFQRFFALQAERLAKLRPAYCECFQEAFRRQYALVGDFVFVFIRIFAQCSISWQYYMLQISHSCNPYSLLPLRCRRIGLRPPSSGTRPSSSLIC